MLAAAESGHDLFQKALVKERTEGDLAGAIQLYQRIVRQHGSNRKLAAQALLQLAQCYEKQGSTEARKTYERLLRDYADQPELVSEARSRLVVLGVTRGPRNGSGVEVRQIWTGPEVDTQGSVSPDGRYLSFVHYRPGPGSRENLAVRNLASGEIRVLTSHRPEESPEASLFSPDGRQIVYAVDYDNPEHGYELRMVGLEGSAPRVVYPYQKGINDLAPQGWSADGKSILTLLRNRGQVQIAWIGVADGSLRVLQTRKFAGPGRTTGRAAVSPDGRHVAYEVQPDSDDGNRDVRVMAADGSGDRALVESRWDDYLLDWTPDGKGLLFGSDRAGTFDAWMLPLAGGSPQGPPILVRREIGEVRPMGLARGGSFYHGFRIPYRDIYIAGLDLESGKTLAPPAALTLPNTAVSMLPVWSPDGRRLAYYTARESRGRSVMRTIVVRSMETGREQELRPDFEAGAGRFGWTPDARFLLVYGRSRKGRGVHRVDVETSQVSLVGELQVPEPGGPVFSPDGKTVLSVAPNPLSLRRHDLETGQEQSLYRPGTGQGIADVIFSPDGRQVAVVVRSRPGWEGPDSLLVLPASGGEPRTVVTGFPNGPQRGFVLSWSADGRWLVLALRAGSGERTEFWRVPVAGGELQKLELSMPGGAMQLQFHPDGRRVAFSAGGRMQHEVWVMENFLPALAAAK